MSAAWDDDREAIAGGDAHYYRPIPEGICSFCRGDDQQMPCAYPSEGKPGCLRDARLAHPAPASTGDSNG